MVCEISIFQCEKMIEQAGGDVWRKEVTEDVEVMVLPKLGKVGKTPGLHRPTPPKEPSRSR